MQGLVIEKASVYYWMNQSFDRFGILLIVDSTY